MNEYLQKHMPETFEALSAGWAAVLEAAGEVSKAQAAQKRAEQAWSDAKAKANAEACAHVAANNPPSGVVVPGERWNPRSTRSSTTCCGRPPR